MQLIESFSTRTIDNNRRRCYKTFSIASWPARDLSLLSRAPKPLISQ